LWGVFGSSHSIDEAAVFGGGYGSSTGVQGYSGPEAAAPPSPPRTGVYGYAVQDATARGVHGQTAIGRGVFGKATSGLGVRGCATTGIGVSAEATTGYALRTEGRIKLDQSAGQASIASAGSSIVVTPGIDLTSSTAVIATLNGNAGGSTTVRRVAIDTGANTFTIFLAANSTANVKSRGSSLTDASRQADPADRAPHHAEDAGRDAPTPRERSGNVQRYGQRRCSVAPATWARLGM
jgi:hypothetical protein